MELPKKGDFFASWSILDQKEKVEVIVGYHRRGSGIQLRIITPEDPTQVYAGASVGYEHLDWDKKGVFYHLVKDHRGYWTKKEQWGECPVCKELINNKGEN